MEKIKAFFSFSFTEKTKAIFAFITDTLIVAALAIFAAFCMATAMEAAAYAFAVLVIFSYIHDSYNNLKTVISPATDGETATDAGETDVSDAAVTA